MKPKQAGYGDEVGELLVEVVVPHVVGDAEMLVVESLGGGGPGFGFLLVLPQLADEFGQDLLLTLSEFLG